MRTCAAYISPWPIVFTKYSAVIAGRFLRGERNKINRKVRILRHCVAELGELLTINRQFQLDELLDDSLADVASDFVRRVGGADKFDNGVKLSREELLVPSLDFADAVLDRKVPQRLNVVLIGQDALFDVQFGRSVFVAIVQSVHVVDQIVNDAWIAC